MLVRAEVNRALGTPYEFCRTILVAERASAAVMSGRDAKTLTIACWLAVLRSQPRAQASARALRIMLSRLMPMLPRLLASIGIARFSIGCSPLQHPFRSDEEQVRCVRRARSGKLERNHLARLWNFCD